MTICGFRPDSSHFPGYLVFAGFRHLPRKRKSPVKQGYSIEVERRRVELLHHHCE